jgi:alkylglycerol monooxygenase
MNQIAFNTIAFAIPAIFILLGTEYFWTKRKGEKYFSFDSSISNISIGIAERLAQLFFAGYFLWVFQFVYGHFALLEIPVNVTSWLLLFLLTDFLWYWYHRLSHEVNILWGAHIVHHQSEEFNLTVSFRITIFQAFIRLSFGLLLPLIGFPVSMVIVLVGTLGIYQFFIHTRTIDKLGWFEQILVTPSHHRVHHGSNVLYLDKNYGGMLIIWDRLFGTFQAETENVKYGLTKPVESSSFLWLHFHFWLELAANVRATGGFRNRLKILFGGPDTLPHDFEGKLRKRFLPSADKDAERIKSADNYPWLVAYVMLQIIGALTGLFLVYLFNFSFPVQFISSLLISITLINCGAILEQKSWIFLIEIIRISLFYTLFTVIIHDFVLLFYLPIPLAGLAWKYTLLKKQYLKVLYTNTSKNGSVAEW